MLTWIMNVITNIINETNIIISNLLKAVTHEWHTNVSWIWMISTVLSAIMGFGIGPYLYVSNPNPSIRYRKGENYVKKVKRDSKEVKPSHRSTRHRPKTPKLTPDMLKPDMVHHPRFNNIPRTERYEHPSIRCI